MKTKRMTLLAILMAMNIALSSFYITVGANLRIYFTFLITMMIAINFDWKTCLVYAVAEDLLSFFLFPSGTFFLGYTLTAVLGVLIYHFFLHEKVDWVRVLIAKSCVNVFVNIFLGSLWSYMLFSKGYLYYLSKSAVKNIAMIPIEVAMFLIVYRLIQPLFNKYLNK